ncbi:RagB/SusD family nutrient uptake outer membrane protein [Parafilimonas sp.]|uniref:RagB/SusD family nutrient uptake outer membrane protein n=1 Tax=Parafilimonas sp. TaxID=1969739 RepID=UPI0039E41E59
MLQQNKIKQSYKQRLLVQAVCIIAIALLGMSSCSKSFTDASANLEGQPAASTFWQSASDAESAVNSIYANLRSWGNVAFPAIAIEETGSDDAEKGSVTSDATYFNQYNSFTVTASQSQLDGFWTAQYQNINYCNQVLDHVDTMSTVSDDDKVRYLAEARFVRAWSYFRLVRAFGRVPLVLHVPTTAEELNPSQNESSEIYDSVENDLTIAAAGLPTEVSTSELGRATKYAALALHAKVSMYRENWEDVLTYTNEVIQSGKYSLFSNFYQLFRIANENNSESIFEIQCDYVSGDDDISDCQYSQVQGNRDASAGWGFNVPTSNLDSAFETDDPRREYTIMTAGSTTPSGDEVPAATAGAPTRYNMKSYVPFTVAQATNSGAGQNIRVIRYAEVLLMNAEANNELGNTADALASLELIRARARGSNSSILPEVTTTDQTTLQTAIWNERRVELAMEGDRYFDVIRQGRGSTIFGSLGWEANKNEVWPIPQTEIDNSGGVLIQNTGY